MIVKLLQLQWVEYLLLHFNWNFTNAIVYRWAVRAHWSSRYWRTFHGCIYPQGLRWRTHCMAIARWRRFRIGTQRHLDDRTRRSLMCEFRLKWRTEHAFIYRPRRFFLRHFSYDGCHSTAPRSVSSTIQLYRYRCEFSISSCSKLITKTCHPTLSLYSAHLNKLQRKKKEWNKNLARARIRFQFVETLKQYDDRNLTAFSYLKRKPIRRDDFSRSTMANHKARTFTKIYDAKNSNIRRWSDSNIFVRFLALARTLCIDCGTTKEQQWASLQISHHYSSNAEIHTTTFRSTQAKEHI